VPTPDERAVRRPLEGVLETDAGKVLGERPGRVNGVPRA
jgi:hypothetical protein